MSRKPSFSPSLCLQCPLLYLPPLTSSPKIWQPQDVVSVGVGTGCVLSHSVRLKYLHPGGRISEVLSKQLWDSLCSQRELFGYK